MVKKYELQVTPEMIKNSYNAGIYHDSQTIGFVIREARANRPGDNTNLPSSQVSDFYVPYVVPDFDSFIQCYEYYRTIGPVQNVVDSIVANIINREWYFESDKPSRIKAMEDWEEKFDLSRIVEQIIRDWCVFGNSIIGFSDWQPMQMTTILGMKRDIYGIPEYFVQTVNGKVVDIDAHPFLFTKFIDMNRDAWGKPLFGSLIAWNYTDVDGKQPLPALQVYRQAFLDSGRVLHRFGSPVVVWSWPGANREVLEKDIKPVMEARRAGDRMIFNEKPELTIENIDTKTKFDNYLEFIKDIIETGLQSSQNRLITDPSAMADAREAGAQDDDRVLGIMEKLRRVINKYVIPRVVGEANVCFFKWGAKDTMELEFPQGLMNAVTPAPDGTRVISVAEARMILSIKGWKLDDGLYQQDLNQQVWDLQQQNQQMQNQMNGMKLNQKEPKKALKGSEPTEQPYDPDISQTDTHITGQGDSPPYRGHNFLSAGSYPQVMPPNATKRGDFGNFGGSLASGESAEEELKWKAYREFQYSKEMELINLKIDAAKALKNKIEEK